MASAYSSSSSVSAQTIGGTSSWTEKSSIWDCGPDVGHRQAGNPNVLAQYLMTNIFKMVSWKKALHALKADSFTHVHPYLIYILNRNITWIASKTFWYSNRRSVTFYKHYRICFYRRRQWLVSWGPDPHDVFSNCHFSTRVRSYRIPVYQWSREVPTETRRCCLRIFCCNR